MTSAFPMAKATAPSPNSGSNWLFPAPILQSEAVTMTFSAEPPLTASTAEFMAMVAALSESVKSTVRVSLGRSTAAAIMAAACFSLYGEVVLAKNKPSRCCPSPFIQPRVAATAIVRLSSSCLATALSPPVLFVPHAREISSLLSRYAGT